MDIYATETLETHFSPSDSLDFQRTLGGFSPNSPLPPPPPTQTLDDLVDSSSVPAELSLDNLSDTDTLSPSRDETLDDRSDSVLFLDVESQEEEEEGGEGDGPSNTSPVSKFSVYSYSYSHWAEPWTTVRETKASPLDCSEICPLVGDSDTIPSASNGPDSELWPLALDTITKPYSHWSEDWLWRGENESKRFMVGAGLANLGNTCFLNAVLQCFTHTVLLVQGLCSCNHSMPCDSHRDGFCVLCAFRDHIEVSLASTIRVISPRKLVDNLSYFSSSFRRYQQEDAHEFLQCFLDRLESCCNGSKPKDATLSFQDDNFVKQGFGGCLVSKLRCCNCGHCSDTYEPSIDLSLEIEDVDTLQTALESFTKVEKIEDPDTKFTCENCDKEVSVEKQLMLEQPPSVAALHLKRFKNNGSYVEKIDKYVEFPLELDLLPYTSDSQNNVELKYDLYAVVVHIGFSSTSGHYYCFIRAAPDTWYKFDDSKVIRVREDFVLSQEAYILFYAKQGTPWFSSFMETQKLSFDPIISNTSPKSVLDNVDPIRTSSPSVANNHNCDVNETSEAADGIYAESSNGSRHDGFEGNEAETPVPLGESNASTGTPFKDEKIFSPSVLKENNSNHKFSEVKNSAIATPPTPPRPPRSDIYEEDPPEILIVSNHPRSADQVYCKRQLNKELEDPERKEACRLLKNMPMSGSRRAEFLACLEGSHSEGSLNNKRSRKMELSPLRDDNPSSARRKPNLSSVMRPLAAGSFR